MTFQAYLDNIEDKTGLTPRQFIELATAKGFGPDDQGGEIVAWLARTTASVEVTPWRSSTSSPRATRSTRST